MIAMLTLWVLGTMLVNWWNVAQDDWHYGRPRTFQMDARVGHNDVVTASHFIAMNLDRHIIIIEFPGGDPTKAKDYIGPTLFGDGQELNPVTLSFKDVNGDGKLEYARAYPGSNLCVYQRRNAVPATEARRTHHPVACEHGECRGECVFPSTHGGSCNERAFTAGDQRVT